MSSTTPRSGTSALFALSTVARLPSAMVTVAVLIHVRAISGSFATAGVCVAALAAGRAIGGPLLARIADRRGQTIVLVPAGLLSAGLLIVLGAAAAHTPAGVTCALAAVAGFASPPIEACLRALLADVVPSGAELRRTYALDATIAELTWITGPPLVFLIATGSTTVALVTVGVIRGLGTLAFAARPASRRWRPSAARVASARGALGSRAIRRLTAILACVGLLFGSTEIAIAAATRSLGHAGLAGPVLALWGAGSLLGGLLLVRRVQLPATWSSLALLLAGLGVSNAALALTTGSALALALAAIPAGAFIAPMYATAYELVDASARPGTTTEAYAWLTTATAVGAAAGAAGAGQLVQADGSAVGFVLGGASAVVAAGIAARARASRRSAALTGLRRVGVGA